MRNFAVSWGCGLIATAPLFAGHLVFINEIKFILISWFSSFISTFLLIFCSLSSLFTKNPWFIFLFSIPFDVVGKVLLKFLATKLNFFKPLGFSMFFELLSQYLCIFYCIDQLQRKTIRIKSYI